MGQNDTIGKIELNPSFILSSDNTNCKNDIQLFPQLFDELRVNGALTLTGVRRKQTWNDTSHISPLSDSFSSL